MRPLDDNRLADQVLGRHKAQWYVKWDVLHYTLNGIDWIEYPLHNDSETPIDWKHPYEVRVYDPASNKTIEETEE